MSGARFFKEMENKILSSINTSMPARVLSYNEGARTAKIKPLIKVQISEGVYQEREVLENVPVLKHRFKVNGGAPQEYIPYLQSGDIVQVVFSQSSIDQAQKGQLTNPSGRRFSVVDAVIVGVFQ
ncbi:Gp138 family membrane-puncturing spike protein [Lysinibacillus sp. 54212]|uniref:Gp138 family membrane-puncturing spike protein n=1 Tax=Lysinibacillus sp. 54212 TaxID=3119829 RepID=UPI002FC9925D